MNKARDIDRTYGHIDAQTGDEALHITKTYTLFTDFEDTGKRKEWRFALRLPAAIYDGLGPTEWERAMRLLDTRGKGEDLSKLEFLIASGSVLGATSRQIQDYVAGWMADTLYRLFCELQISRGNKAWLVPASMQKVGNPNG